MANRNFTRSQVLNRGEVVLCGSFAPNGSSAVDSASTQGIGFSVARTSTGLFTITLDDSYVAMLSANVSLQLTAGDDKMLQIGVVDVVTAKTVQVRVWGISGAAVADISAAAGNRINFSLRLKNSTTN